MSFVRDLMGRLRGWGGEPEAFVCLGVWPAPAAPPLVCDGSDDAALRCGFHHVTGLACWHGGYECCCGEPWLIKADRCLTRAEHGDPVVHDGEETADAS